MFIDCRVDMMYLLKGKYHTPNENSEEFLYSDWTANKDGRWGWGIFTMIAKHDNTRGVARIKLICVAS